MGYLGHTHKQNKVNHASIYAIMISRPFFSLHDDYCNTFRALFFSVFCLVFFFSVHVFFSTFDHFLFYRHSFSSLSLSLSFFVYIAIYTFCFIVHYVRCDFIHLWLKFKSTTERANRLYMETIGLGEKHEHKKYGKKTKKKRKDGELED